MSMPCPQLRPANRHADCDPHGDAKRNVAECNADRTADRYSVTHPECQEFSIFLAEGIAHSLFFVEVGGTACRHRMQGRPSIAACRADKLSDCHHGQPPTHNALRRRQTGSTNDRHRLKPRPLIHHRRCHAARVAKRGALLAGIGTGTGVAGATRAGMTCTARSGVGGAPGPAYLGPPGPA